VEPPNEYVFLGSIPAEAVFSYVPYEPTEQADEIFERIQAELEGKYLVLLVAEITVDKEIVDSLLREA